MFNIGRTEIIIVLDTDLMVEIADTNTNGNNTESEVKMKFGDCASIKCVPTGSPSSVYMWWSCVGVVEEEQSGGGGEVAYVF